MDENSERIARMRQWINENGLNQKDLADGVGMSAGAISRFMSGQREFTAEFEVNFLKAYGIEAAQAALGLVLAS